MSTLAELLGEYGLIDGNQEKTASALDGNNSKEVNQILESLGLSGADEGVEKVANATIENKGESMSLTGIYEKFFDESAPAQDTEVAALQKEASEEGTEGNEGTGLFGELVGHYFQAAQGAYHEKVAASVEEEVEKGELPMAHLENKSSLGASMGKVQDPHMPMNHSASGGHELKASIGGQFPYPSIKEKAQMKAILKRMAAAPVGAYKD